MPFLSSGTSANLQEALRLVTNQVFVAHNGDRMGVTDKLVLVIDGQSNISAENTEKEVDRLKVNGY